MFLLVLSLAIGNERSDVLGVPFVSFLAPGLIAMPDLSAIDAVLNYTKHSYYYFAADADRLGYHKFAKTLTQHNVNARDYQRYLSSQGIRN